MSSSAGRAGAAGVLLAGLVAACALPIAPEDDENGKDTSEVASALADAVDARCNAAFTDADAVRIRDAIAASDLTPGERVSHALNRFGFGDRFAGTAIPADTATALSNQIVASLRRGASITASARASMDAALPNLAIDPGDLHYRFRRLYIERDAARAAGDSATAATRDAQITALRDDILDELGGKQVMAAALAPDIGLGEHLTSFWLNHFSVDGRVVAIWAPQYERTMRTSLCGTFEQLLLAVARSPAMLRFLDNHASTAPGTTHWSGATDINENYARELLELHSLGTGPRTTTNTTSPYTQSDIIKVAHILTGWSYTYASDQRSTSFQFQSQYHVKGTKTVMGVVYPEGETGGRSLITRLANQPQTKRFICDKLASHFLASPPAAVVDACVAAWGTGGALPRMYTAILAHPQTWKSTQYGNKVKNPLELVVSSHRLSGDAEATLTKARVEEAVKTIRTMGMPLWRIDFPTGYSTEHLDWLDPGYLNEQVQYVYSQSDPLGLRYGTSTGTALENQFVSMAKTPAQKLALARTSVLPTRSVSFPETLDDTFLATAFTDPDRAPSTAAPSRPVRTLLSFYATSWQFLVK